MLVLNINLAGLLVPSTGYPPNPKTKSCYFIKKEPMVFVKNDPGFKNFLVYGDLSANPLEHLVTFVEDVRDLHHKIFQNGN